MSHPTEGAVRPRRDFLSVALFFLLLIPGLVPAICHAADESVSVTLKWTAPGDDSTRGRATAYDLRRSMTPITELNFSAATVITGLAAPQAAGSLESFTVAGLTSGVEYYFALRTKDDAGNWSKISNLVVFPSLVGVSDPGTTLAFSNPFPNPSREPVHFACSLPRAAEADVDVFDVTGRSVRTLMSGLHPPGQSELVWDLKSDHGATVAPGVYLVHAKIAGQQWNRRVVVTR